MKSRGIRPRLAVIVCGWCGCEPVEPCLLGQYADWLVVEAKRIAMELDASYLTAAWALHADLPPDDRLRSLVRSMCEAAKSLKVEG